MSSTDRSTQPLPFPSPSLPLPVPLPPFHPLPFPSASLSSSNTASPPHRVTFMPVCCRCAPLNTPLHNWPPHTQECTQLVFHELCPLLTPLAQARPTIQCVCLIYISCATVADSAAGVSRGCVQEVCPGGVQGVCPGSVQHTHEWLFYPCNNSQRLSLTAACHESSLQSPLLAVPTPCSPHSLQSPLLTVPTPYSPHSLQSPLLAVPTPYSPHSLQSPLLTVPTP